MSGFVYFESRPLVSMKAFYIPLLYYKSSIKFYFILNIIKKIKLLLYTNGLIYIRNNISINLLSKYILYII